MSIVTSNATSDVIVGDVSAWALFVNYLPVLVFSFLAVLVLTPVFRQLALASGVVDNPDDARKIHKKATPYLGGLAVFTGLLIGIAISYALVADEPSAYRPLPLSIVGGMLAITFTGLADDVWGWDPRLKIAGQLVAAALLAVNDIGTQVAAGLFGYLFGMPIVEFSIPLPFMDIPIDVTYWMGTFIIAMFVLGGCNASNLIDGLDGLLSGTVAIIAIGLLFLSLMMASALTESDLNVISRYIPEDIISSEGVTLSGARITLCMALLGAVLGFLPHNFNPATIFLGDCGSLLLGYCCVVIILMLGEQGQTHLVLAGLLIFGVPIIDTILAICRRKVQGLSMSSPDARHLHHILKSWFGGVKRAVLAIYGIELIMASIGTTLGVLSLLGDIRMLVVYIVFIALYSLVAVAGIRMGISRRKRIAAAAGERP